MENSKPTSTEPAKADLIRDVFDHLSKEDKFSVLKSLIEKLTIEEKELLLIGQGNSGSKATSQQDLNPLLNHHSSEEEGEKEEETKEKEEPRKGDSINPYQSFDINPSSSSILTKNENGAQRLEETNFKKDQPSYDEDILQEYILHGGLFREIGQLEKALECFNKAIEIKPDFDNYYSRIGILMSLKRFEKAVADINQALKLTSDDEVRVKLLSLKSIFLEEQGELVKAAEATEEALKINFRSRYSWSRKCSILSAQDKHVSVVKCANEAINIFINEAPTEFYISKIQSLTLLQNYQDALEANKGLRKIDIDLTGKEKFRTYYLRGVIIDQQGGHEEAKNCFRQALNLGTQEEEDRQARDLIFIRFPELKDSLNVNASNSTASLFEQFFGNNRYEV